MLKFQFYNIFLFFLIYFLIGRYFVLLFNLPTIYLTLCCTTVNFSFCLTLLYCCVGIKPSHFPASPPFVPRRVVASRGKRLHLFPQPLKLICTVVTYPTIFQVISGHISFLCSCGLFISWREVRNGDRLE